MKNYQDISNEELKKLTDAYINEWVDICRLAKSLARANEAAYDIQNNYDNEGYYSEIKSPNFFHFFDTGLIHVPDMRDSVSHACRKSKTILLQIESELTDIFTVICSKGDKDILGFTLPSVFNNKRSCIYDEFFTNMTYRMPDTVSDTSPSSAQKNKYLFSDTAQKVIEDCLPTWEKNISIDKTAEETEEVKE